MAELTHAEHLQPSLLDRLTDEEPEKKQESRARRVLSMRQLRAGVLRDLSWLMNCVNLSAVQDLEAFPHVPDSVLNYGLPDLAGHTASSVDAHSFERLLRAAIVDFEPRLLKNSVKVRLLMDESHMDHNTMMFEIEGRLWAQPMPLHLYMKTEVDFESGTVRVQESSAS